MSLEVFRVRSEVGTQKNTSEFIRNRSVNVFRACGGPSRPLRVSSACVLEFTRRSHGLAVLYSATLSPSVSRISLTSPDSPAF